MSHVALDALPGDARAWCFGASEPLPDDVIGELRAAMESFIERWTAHRAELHAGFDWLHDRFLIVAVDESRVGASGCSIDALTAEIRRLEGVAGVALLDAAPVWYRDAGGEIRRVSRDEFRRLAADGRVGPDTVVFDLTADRLEAVRTGGWEVEAGRSWHAGLL
ncbi:MAG: hypothetical protein ACOC9N_02425 [Gemmatimonadota bacterium]